MNILYFDPKFATPRLHAPSRTYSFARHLVAHDHEVTVVALDRRAIEPGRARRPENRLFDRERVDGFDVVWVRIPYAQRFSKWKRLLSYGAYTVAAALAAARLGRPDAVFASSTPLTVGIDGIALARARRVPFVFEILDVWPDVPIELGFLTNRAEIAAAKWLELRLYAGAERVIVSSASARAVLLAKGVPEEKLVLIPNLADVELFRSAAPNTEFLAQLGLDGRFVALYTGAMGKANGVHQLAEAALALREGGHDEIAIVALGNGTGRLDLERRVAELGLDNLLLPPPVSRDEIAGIVGAADATLTIFAPYRTLETNTPNKFFDSLAAGKPVVVNLGGWLRALTEENRAGLYVPAGDSQALADALVRLAENPELAEELGRNGRELAEREFDREFLAARFRGVLEDVVSRERSAARA